MEKFFCQIGGLADTVTECEDCGMKELYVVGGAFQGRCNFKILKKARGIRLLRDCREKVLVRANC